MKDAAFELIWTLFWIAMGFLGIFLAWNFWVIFVFFLLAGVIYVDLDGIF